MGFFNISKGGSGVELNKIYNEDCLEGMKRIPDGSVDMILCDLPYGTTACKWDTIIPFEPLWEQYDRIIKNNGAIILFGVEPFSSLLRTSNIDNYKYDWYWNKKHGANFAQANKRPLKSIEVASVFYKKQPTYNPQKIINPKGVEGRSKYAPSKQKKVFEGQVSMNAEYAGVGSKYEADKLLPKCLIEFSREYKPIHPTQKPVSLFEYFIKTYTNEGETVLDNCIGSGTTAIACLNTNRNYIGFELDKGYFDIANNRIDKYKRNMAKDN